MSVIGNISILQNPQAKKAFSNISFEAGEKFNARVVSSDSQKGEINLKLLDGWQFSAKLDKPLEQDPNGSVLKFEVEGFVDDKLKIKIVYEDKEGKTVSGEGLEEYSKGKTLSNGKMDAMLFEKMIKHDMPLTKDNIIDIKNLVDFREKISLNSNKEEIFIAKYLESRNIDLNSEKAKEITTVLKNFFEALKKLDIDEILLFKENNLELTKGNLDSFVKLFKGQSAIYNDIKDINNYFLSNDASKNISGNIQNSEASNSENSFMGMDNSNEDLTNLDIKNSNKQTNSINKPIENKILKELVNLINKELKDLGMDHRVLNSTIKNLETDKILSLQNNSLDSGTVKALVDKIFKGQQISLSPNSYNELIDNLTVKLNIALGGTSNSSLETVKQNEEVPINAMQNKEVNINIKLNEELSKNIIANKELPIDIMQEKEVALKSPLNSELPINILPKIENNGVEQSNKNAVSNNAYGYGKNNSLNDIINMIKKELNISEIDKGIINNVEKDIQKITTDSLFKDQIKLKTEEIKSIVKDVIENKLNIKPETYEKVMNLFHEKLNDVKMFNSISEQYYYLDLPINVKEEEYQFKLIIKDDRKKGKKIDSKNVKIATSVKTINMGTVDAYIKISNNNMNIDINCDEFWVKVLKLGKEKLISDLSNLNYRVNIEVNNKVKEFTLANCGEFFNDRSFNAINIKV